MPEATELPFQAEFSHDASGWTAWRKFAVVDAASEDEAVGAVHVQSGDSHPRCPRLYAEAPLPVSQGGGQYVVHVVYRESALARSREVERLLEQANALLEQILRRIS